MRKFDKMTVYFMDFQGFFLNNELVIKELCLMNANDPFNPFYRVYKMNIPWHLLPADTAKTNNYLTNNCHRLSWEEGTTTFCPNCVLHSSKKDLLTVIIYVLDTENGSKMSTLKKYFPTLRFTSYNKTISQLPKTPSNISCIFRDHHHVNCAYKHCISMCIDYYKC